MIENQWSFPLNPSKRSRTSKTQATHDLLVVTSIWSAAAKPKTPELRKCVDQRQTLYIAYTLDNSATEAPCCMPT